MNTILIYLAQLIVTLLACLGLAAYIRPHLRRVLADLCGTEERALFWTVFSNLMLVVMPVIFGLGFVPVAETSPAAFFELADQLRWNLLGFIFSLVCIAGAVAFFAMVAPRPTKQQGG